MERGALWTAKQVAARSRLWTGLLRQQPVETKKFGHVVEHVSPMDTVSPPRGPWGVF
jgi:hypothetical protein